MEYEDFELQIGPRTEEGYLLHVLRSPAGEGEGLLQLPPEIGELERVHRPAADGHDLFRALFRERISELFHRSLHRTDSGKTGSGLRIRLRIHSGEAALHQIPWELLYRKPTQEFLALSRKTPIVRALDVPRSTALPPFSPPLRILIVLSQDPHGSVLGLEKELDRLEKALEAKTDVQTKVLRDPDPLEVRKELLRQPYHVLHYMGHGSFQSDRSEGVLHFGGQEGERVEVTGQYLATLLNDAESLRLVVLNACESARSASVAGNNPFSGAATALVLGGLPAVVAMQSRIGDHDAIAFSASFYDQLAHGWSIEEAVNEGRQAILAFRPAGESWAIPVLFLRTPTGDLFKRFQETTEPPSSPHLPPLKPTWRWVMAMVAVLSLPLFLVGRSIIDAQWKSLDTTIAAEILPIPGRPSLPLKGKKTVAQNPSSPSSSSSAPARSSRTVAVGSGESAFRFNVSAGSDFVDAFAQSLQSSARRLADFGLPGASVSITVNSPTISGSTAGGLSDTSCRLQATGRVAGKSFSIGPLTRAAENASAACRIAAEDLAELVPDKISQLL